MTSIDELRAVANREHAATDRARVAIERAASDYLDHAIRAGEALAEIRAQVPEGSWGEWLAQNFDASAFTARIYIRFAKYQEQLRAEDASDYATALQIIREIDAAGRPTPKEDRERRELAQKLADGGASYRELGDEFGVDATTVQRWLKPKARQKLAAVRRVSTRDELEQLIALCDDALLIANRLAASQAGFRIAVKTLRAIRDAMQARLVSVQEVEWIARCDCSRPLLSEGECAKCGKPATLSLRAAA